MTATSVSSPLIDHSVRFLGTEASYGSLTSTDCDTAVASDEATSCRSSQLCHKKWGRYLFPRTKPTILVLLWMFLINISSGYMFSLIVQESGDSLTSSTIVFGANVILLLVIPVAGFLADVYWGQFRLILFGVSTGWLVLVEVWIGILYISTVGTNNLFPLLVYMVPACALSLVAMFGGSGFLANIIQFGVDQLPYAPSEEINIYIHWIVWTKQLGGTVASITAPLILAGLNINWKQAISLTLVGLLVVITGAVVFVSIYYGQHWFRTEYTRKNLYSLICKVLKFARNHKTPINRSAFTYCENDPPSRIDLGKTKFGGPFTTEQVENVKTFLRISGLLLTTCPVPALGYILFYTPAGSYSVAVCAKEFKYASMLVIVVTETLVIPINILIIYPMFRNCYPGALKRMGLAMILLLSAVLVKLIISLVSIHTIEHHPEEFVNCTTGFQNGSQWITVLIPGFLTGVSVAIFYPAFFAFICAQSPQYMMGILIGVSFVIQGLFMLLGNVFILPTIILRSKFSQNSYEWVTYLVSFLFGAGGLFLYTAVARLYKFRERDEEPKDQIYVEAYYNKIIQ